MYKNQIVSPSLTVPLPDNAIALAIQATFLFLALRIQNGSQNRYLLL